MIKTKKNLVLFMPFIGGGGVEKNLYIIANYLSLKFNNLLLCTISTKYKKKFDKSIKFIVPKKKWSEKINIRIIYLICLYNLFKYLIKNRNCVVLSFQANVYCILVCKLLNIRIIIRSNSSPSGWYHNFIKKSIYKILISFADIVIVNSYSFKKQMEDRFNIKVKCIYNPLNTKEILRLSKKKRKDQFFITKKKIVKVINFGRLTEQKDHMTLLKAMRLLKKNINFRLIIFGKGIEHNKLSNFIKENDLSNNVKIRNFVDNPFPALVQADIFVLCSRYEGLPNALLEAIVLKKTSISSNCPTGPREILSNGKGGTLFKVGDYKGLASRIEYCLKNKKLISQKKMYAYKKLKRYDYDKNLIKYTQLIKPFLITHKN